MSQARFRLESELQQNVFVFSAVVLDHPFLASTKEVKEVIYFTSMCLSGLLITLLNNFREIFGKRTNAGLETKTRRLNFRFRFRFETKLSLTLQSRALSLCACDNSYAIS